MALCTSGRPEASPVLPQLSHFPTRSYNQITTSPACFLCYFNIIFYLFSYIVGYHANWSAEDTSLCYQYRYSSLHSHHEITRKMVPRRWYPITMEHVSLFPEPWGSPMPMLNDLTNLLTPWFGLRRYHSQGNNRKPQHMYERKKSEHYRTKVHNSRHQRKDCQPDLSGSWSISVKWRQ